LYSCKGKKRDDILKAALQLFVERCEQSTSMKCVAKAAKCGIGTIYNYFPSKDQLISVLYLSTKTALFSKILKYHNIRQAVKKQFFNIWLNVIEYATKHPGEYTFIEAFSYSPKITEEVNIQLNELILPLLKIFERGKKEGIFKDVKCSQMLIFISGAIASSILKQSLTSQQEKQDLVAMAWDAIKN